MCVASIVVYQLSFMVFSCVEVLSLYVFAQLCFPYGVRKCFYVLPRWTVLMALKGHGLLIGAHVSHVHSLPISDMPWVMAWLMHVWIGDASLIHYSVVWCRVSTDWHPMSLALYVFMHGPAVCRCLWCGCLFVFFNLFG